MYELIVKGHGWSITKRIAATDIKPFLLELSSGRTIVSYNINKLTKENT